MTEHTHIDPAALPLPIRTFLTAHEARDTEAALGLFAPAAVVVDDGRTYRGTAEIPEFLEKAGSEFTYTSELTGADQIDSNSWVAIHHLEGDFPGGVADLGYRFTLDDALIASLTIAPV